ncbi:MAG: universal stress protein, partial [Sphingobacteriaceae bacterium]
AILEVQEETQVDLLVLCSKKNAKEDTQVGRNIIEISKISPAPVLVIPDKTTAQPLKKIVLACDFKKVTEIVPQQQLKKIWELLQAELLVVNADTKSLPQQKEAKMLAEESALAAMLADYQPQYFHISHADAVQGIVEFAMENQAQLIISLPRKHNFFTSLWNSNFSDQLTVKSTLPVLLLK